MLLEIVKWVILYILLSMLSKLWQQAQDKWNQEKGQAQGQGGQGRGGRNQKQSSLDEDNFDEWDKAEENARREAREAKIRKMIQRDPKLKDELARLGDLDPQDLKDPELVKKLAESLSDAVVDIMEVSSRDAAIDLDLATKTVMEEVPNAGMIKQVGRIDSPEEMRKMRPIEWAMPPSLRNARIATRQAQKIVHYNLKPRRKVLYLLEDLSGSMVDGLMRDGLPRFIWARGVIIRFAKQAMAGNTKIIYRGFDEKPKQAIFAGTKQEVQKFMDYLLSKGPTQGGTNIFNAFARAVADIRSKAAEFEDAEIVIVTDTDDQSMDDVRQIKRMLGGDIKLHIIATGGSNSSLKQVATTYKVIN